MYRRTVFAGRRLSAMSAARLRLASVQRNGAEQPERVSHPEAPGRAQLFAPARAGAVAVFAEGGVPAQPGDHREDVFAVGVDADPAAGAAATPVHEAGRVQWRFE